MKKLLLAVAGTFFSLVVGSTVSAGTLVSGGTVIKVINSRSENDLSFVIFTQGGTGPCTNGPFIAFYPSDGSDAEKLKRAYAAALLALAAGLKVTISNDTNTTCTAAVHIEISPM